MFELKKMRIERNYTLEMLASATGFTKGYLSKIERSPTLPPFATVQKIAEALQFEVADLFSSKKEVFESHNIDLVKHAEMGEQTDVYSFTPLVNSYRNKQMAPFMFAVKTGATETTTHDSEEFVYVIEGCVELNYEDTTYHLEKGDSFYLDARIAHNFVNRQEFTASLLAVHFNYRRF